MWGGYVSNENQATIDTVKSCKAIMAQYRGRYGNLNKKEKIELDMALKLLEDTRSRCRHNWEVVQMFSTVQKRCEYCDDVDKNYDHFRDGKRSDKIKLDWPWP